MDDIDITNFLPIYPWTEDSDFYSNLYQKKEFYDLKLPAVEDINSLEGGYFKHQKIIARFMSVYTPYIGILVVHRMGTGKTKAAIAASELARQASSTIDGAVVCARGDALLDNFRNEITGSNFAHYIPENFDLLTEGEKITRQRVLLRQWYYYSQRIRSSSFGATFYELAKRVSSLTDDEIIATFSNKVFIVDEVHNIRPRESKEGEESVQVYSQFHRLFHTARNIKVLLLSGTPIKDTLDEFANVMNLILPLDEQIAKKQFIPDYFEKAGEYLLPKAEMVPVLKQKLRGRVSYLQSMDSIVKLEFQGERGYGGLRHFTVYPVNMSNFQTKYYTPLYVADSEGKGTVYLDSRQASAFVFPDGSQGDVGFKKWIVKVAGRRGVGETSESWFRLSDAFEKELQGTEADPLSKLRKFGAVYAKTIELVVKKAAEGKLQFVYGEYVTGSGSILFALLLEKFGRFSRAKSGNIGMPSDTPRYGLINNMASTGAESRNLRDKFNSPENLRGRYINTIIGSSVTAEGFSLLNVQAEYILTPHWNYTETDQAIARGNRVGSHNRLIQAGIVPELQVYQFVAMPTPEYRVKSVDLEMYLVSEVKDVNVKRLERVIKEAAFDCALDYDRNHHEDGVDGSRDCDYEDCEYTCDGVPPEWYKHSGDTIPTMDWSTYNLYYTGELVDKLKEQIQLFFRVTFSASFEELRDNFSTVSKYALLTALKDIITNTLELRDKYNQPCYLKEYMNTYFLVSSLAQNDTPLSEFYTQHPVIAKKLDYADVLLDIRLKMSKTSIQSVFELTNFKTIRAKLFRLPLEVQAIVLESCIIAKLAGTDKGAIQRNIILQIYKNSYITLETGIVVANINGARCLDPTVTPYTWSNCDETLKALYETALKSQRVEATQQYQGYYGIYNDLSDSFCIVRPQTDPGNRSTAALTVKTGQLCTTWKKKELLPICIKVFGLLAPTAAEDVPDHAKYWSAIRGLSREQLIAALLRDDSQTKPYLTEEELEPMPLDLLQSAQYWRLQSLKALCPYLQKWMEERDLVLPSQNCGTSRKKKKTLV